MTENTAERRLPVVGYEGLYEVSDRGRVWSLPRLVNGPHGLRRWPGRELKWCIRPDGYPSVNLCRDGKARHRFVHHLVLEAFNRPRPDGMEARHGPGGKLRPWITNLCWGTREDNVGPDRVRDGQSNRGARQWKSKLNPDLVREIRRRTAAGEEQKALATEFGMSTQGINDVVLGKNWAHVV
jgi:hypothetical protein